MYKCIKCGSEWFYTTSEYHVCRKCGHKEPLKDDKKEEGENAELIE